MTKEQFLSSIKRITSFYGGSRDKEDSEKTQNYFSALYEQMHWMDAGRFDDVCRHMVPNLNPIKKPMLRSFLDCYNSLFPDERSKESDAFRVLTGAELTQHLYEKGMQLNPNQARHVLKLSEMMNVPFPQGVRDILEQTANVPVVTDVEIEEDMI